MTEMITKLGERIITLMRVVNLYNMESNKLSHELHGMLMAMRAMDIEFEIEYNSEVTNYTAIIIMGKKFEV